jgi:hypothetical protein
MALDSRRERQSAASFIPFQSMVVPDGSIDNDDRWTAAWMYCGIPFYVMAGLINFNLPKRVTAFTLPERDIAMTLPKRVTAFTLSETE